MFSPDKLDVELKDLFKYGEYYTIKNGKDGYVDVFIRVPSEEDVNLSRVYALRKSAEYRKELEEDAALLDALFIELYGKTIEDFTDDELVELYLIGVHNKLLELARKQVKVPFPKEPKTDDLKLWEEYQKGVDNWPKKYAERLKEVFIALIDKEKEKVKKLDEDKLRNLVRQAIVDIQVNEYYKSKYMDHLIYRVSFKSNDMEERLFKSVEEVENLPFYIKKDFEEAINILNIEVGTLKK